MCVSVRLYMYCISCSLSVVYMYTILTLSVNSLPTNVLHVYCYDLKELDTYCSVLFSYKTPKLHSFMRFVIFLCYLICLTPIVKIYSSCSLLILFCYIDLLNPVILSCHTLFMSV